jgi:ABC-2 type transport system ATP-binding protein
LNTILQLHQLDKKYGNIHAVNQLSFNIEKGNVYGILGPNGSGKSTTLGMLLNVVNPTSGSFQWFDGKISTHDALKKVGAIIERPNFYPYMTASQNLALVCKIKSISTDKIDEKLEIVSLFERRNDRFRTYSLGMKQRLAIASALLNDPEILILDEPTNGLDPKGIQEIRNIIKLISQQGTTILLASHLLDEVEKVCSHVVVLQKGQKLYEGRTDQMTQSYGMIEIKTDKSYDDMAALLHNYSGIEKISLEPDFILCYLNQDIDSALLNKFLLEHNIMVSHLRKTKPTLEQRFLDLTE